MTNGVPPQGGKDAYTRDQMQLLGQMIDERLPGGWGFALFCFPLDSRPGRTNYVSNGRREDIMKEIGLWLEWNKREDIMGRHV